MYGWIISEHASIGITPDDVMVISSDSKHEYFLRMYQDNPEILMTKKIVLITHARFWTDLINYFLIYNPQSRINPFDGDFSSLMCRQDLRQYVIFDETPKFIQSFFKMPKCLLAAFTERDASGNWQCLPTEIMKDKYFQFFKDSDDNPFPNDVTVIGRIKRDVIFRLIPNYLGHWCGARNGTLDMTFTPMNLAQRQINTRIMILEGAGDLLFGNSQEYQLLDIPQKYDCQLHFEQFQFGLKRRGNLDETAFCDFISTLSNRIALNQQYGIKTLVVVWKNQGPNSKRSDDSLFYEHVLSSIQKVSGLDDKMYAVIYYGSAQCKSTNQYRDFSEIILAGDWNTTAIETSKFNAHFGVNIDADSLKLWFFVQLLCRIGIRCHDHKVCSVCYSSDISPRFIANLQNYLSYNMLPKCQKSGDKTQELKDYLVCLGIRSNYQEEIISLCEYDSEISEHLLRQEKYSFSITLDEISVIVPKDKKKRAKYSNLIRVM